MTTPEASSAEAPQFDRADVPESTGPQACEGCGRPLTSSYYEVNGKVACPECRDALAARHQGGSAAIRMVKALALGSVAGAIGSAIWYAVGALFNIEAGIIAIAVGFLVGTGVRIGSEGRGGKPYQLLAIAITYVAIVTAYMPIVLKAIREAPTEQAEAGKGREEAKPKKEGGGEAETPMAPAPETLPGVAAVGLAFAVIFAIAFVSPFLGGFKNILGIIIIGIALYEAWVLNRKAMLSIAGPFQLAPSPAASPGP